VASVPGYAPRVTRLWNERAHPQFLFLCSVFRADRVRRAFGHRGTIYILKGNYDRAIADFNEAIKLTPEDAFSL